MTSFTQVLLLQLLLSPDQLPQPRQVAQGAKHCFCCFGAPSDHLFLVPSPHPVVISNFCNRGWSTAGQIGFLVQPEHLCALLISTSRVSLG